MAWLEKLVMMMIVRPRLNRILPFFNIEMKMKSYEQWWVRISKKIFLFFGHCCGLLLIFVNTREIFLPDGSSVRITQKDIYVVFFSTNGTSKDAKVKDYFWHFSDDWRVTFLVLSHSHFNMWKPTRKVNFLLSRSHATMLLDLFFFFCG